VPDPARILLRAGGCARRTTLLDCGVTDRQLNRELRDGRIVRPAYGVYALPDADPAIVGAVRLGGLLTCDTGARVLGFAVIAPSIRPHIATRSPPAAAVPGVLRHVWRADRADRPVPVVRAADCAAHALRCLPALSALVIVDSALASGATEQAEVIARLTNRGSAAARTVLSLADPSSESPLETVARVLLRVRGLHVETQIYLDGVGRVDLLVEGVLVVELDGFAYHADRAHYRDDRRRGNAIACLGLGLIRFTYEDVVHGPDRVVACVLLALSRVGRGRGTSRVRGTRVNS
jgi:very-short-patch-repair endonuclease